MTVAPSFTSTRSSAPFGWMYVIVGIVAFPASSKGHIATGSPSRLSWFPTRCSEKSGKTPAGSPEDPGKQVGCRDDRLTPRARRGAVHLEAGRVLRRRGGIGDHLGGR